MAAVQTPLSPIMSEPTQPLGSKRSSFGQLPSLSFKSPIPLSLSISSRNNSKSRTPSPETSRSRTRSDSAHSSGHGKVLPRSRTIESDQGRDWELVQTPSSSRPSSRPGSRPSTPKSSAFPFFSSGSPTSASNSSAGEDAPGNGIKGQPSSSSLRSKASAGKKTKGPKRKGTFLASGLANVISFGERPGTAKEADSNNLKEEPEMTRPRASSEPEVLATPIISTPASATLPSEVLGSTTPATMSVSSSPSESRTGFEIISPQESRQSSIGASGDDEAVCGRQVDPDMTDDSGEGDNTFIASSPLSTPLDSSISSAADPKPDVDLYDDEDAQEIVVWSYPSLLSPPNPAFVAANSGRKGGILRNALRPSSPPLQSRHHHRHHSRGSQASPYSSACSSSCSLGSFPATKTYDLPSTLAPAGQDASSSVSPIPPSTPSKAKTPKSTSFSVFSGSSTGLSLTKTNSLGGLGGGGKDKEKKLSSQTSRDSLKSSDGKKEKKNKKNLGNLNPDLLESLQRTIEGLSPQSELFEKMAQEQPNSILSPSSASSATDAKGPCSEDSVEDISPALSSSGLKSPPLGASTHSMGSKKIRFAPLPSPRDLDNPEWEFGSSRGRSYSTGRNVWVGGDGHLDFRQQIRKSDPLVESMVDQTEEPDGRRVRNSSDPDKKSSDRIKSMPLALNTNLDMAPLSKVSSTPSGKRSSSSDAAGSYTKRLFKPLLTGGKKSGRRNSIDSEGMGADIPGSPASALSPPPTPGSANMRGRRANYPPVAQRSRWADPNQPPRPYQGGRYRPKVEEPTFVEWGFGGAASGAKFSQKKSTSADGEKVDDDDDGGGMAWVKKRRLEREQRMAKEKEEKEREEQEKQTARDEAEKKLGGAPHANGDADANKLTIPSLKVTSLIRDSTSTATLSPVETPRATGNFSLKQDEAGSTPTLMATTSAPSTVKGDQTPNSGSDSGVSSEAVGTDEDDAEEKEEEEEEEEEEGEAREDDESDSDDEEDEEELEKHRNMVKAAGREVWHGHKDNPDGTTKDHDPVNTVTKVPPPSPRADNADNR